MTASSRTTIKSFFETGDFPSQSNFSDFIDSAAFLNVSAKATAQAFQGSISIAGSCAVSGDLSTGRNLNVAGSCAISGDLRVGGNASFNTIIVSAGIPFSSLPQIPANSILGNNTGVSANVTNLTVSQVTALLSSPQVTNLSSGSGTYSTPANTKYLIIEMVGGGGGGAGSGTTPTAAGDGGNTTFGTTLLTCSGGGKGLSSGAVGAAGTASGGDLNITGGVGGGASGLTNAPGGMGGISYLGGSGPGGSAQNGGQAAQPNTGSGGGGAGDAAVNLTGGGGGAGGYLRKLITSPLSSYAYGVGAAGTAGGAGGSGFAGGGGGSGVIVVTAFFQ